MLADLAPQFAFEYDDTTAGSANVATVLTGIAATASGSTNTKGSWAQVVSATDRDWYGFWISFSSAVSPAGLNAAQLVDVGIGGAGSETVLVPNILAGGRFVLTGGAISSVDLPVYVPVSIAKGTRVAVRTQAATASRVCRVNIWGESGSSMPRPIYSGCDTYGIDLSTSKGVELTSNASANTFGSWTNVGGTTSRNYQAFLISAQVPALTTVSNRAYLIEGGYSGAGYMRIAAGTTTNETWGAAIPAQYVGQNVPSGTQLQARISCGTASNTELPSVAFHCFY